MPSPKGGGTHRTVVGASRTVVGGSLAAFALLAGLVAASPALAGPDPLTSSSSVVLQLRSSQGLKLKPKTLTVPVNAGSDLDPTTGAGTIDTNKKFTATRQGHKTKVKITVLTFGANGGAGKIDAKVGKSNVNGFGKLSGGTLKRDGFGAKLDGVVAKLGKKGAKALRQALSGGIKAGQPLGTASVTSVPKTVQVLPGGTLEFQADLGFGTKLIAHCVNATLPGGLEVIPPATEPALGKFVFPVTGGSIAPDFSSGRVISAGGFSQKKNDNGTFVPGCSSGVPLGTTVTQTEWEDEFDIRALAANTVLPSGPVGIAQQGPFDLAAATTSADPNTRQVTVSGAPVTMDFFSAVILNNVFPNASGNPNNDFKEGDLLGKMSLSVTTH